MTSRTAWAAGNGVGLTWTTLFASGDLTSLAAGSTVLSSASDIANGANLDQFMDISFLSTISSTAIAAGSNIALFLMQLQQDGSTYGDGSLVAGTQNTVGPALAPCAIIPLRTATYTALQGGSNRIIIPPGSFRMALQNNSGATLSATAANNVCKYRTYNVNLNN